MSELKQSCRERETEAEAERANSLFCPFVLFRPSLDSTVPTHRGKGHLLYSVR